MEKIACSAKKRYRLLQTTLGFLGKWTQPKCELSFETFFLALYPVLSSFQEKGKLKAVLRLSYVDFFLGEISRKETLMRGIFLHNTIPQDDHAFGQYSIG